MLSFFLFSLNFLALNSLVHSQVLESIVARVNGTPISLSLFNDLKKTLTKSQGTLQEEEVLQFIIQNELLEQMAQKKGLRITQEEIQRKMKELQKQSGANTQQDFLEFLKQQGIDNFHILRYQIKQGLVQSKLAQYMMAQREVSPPNEEELKKIYEENEENFHTKDTVQIAHIFIEITTEEAKIYSKIQYKEELAQKIFKMIQNEEASFKTLAQQYSNDLKSKNRGGLLGWYDKDRLEKMSLQYEELAFSMEKNSISDLIWTDQGIHILKLLDRKQGKKTTYDEARKFVLDRALQQRILTRIQKMLEMKKKRSSIQVFL